jgi:tetratricopeptide (TPR) repeat protein
MTLLLAVLACLGTLGRLEASRRAQLDLILAVRDELQETLDDERSLSGPLAPSAVEPGARSRESSDWAAQLEARIEKYTSSRKPAAETEETDLRLGQASLAVATGKFSHALALTEKMEEVPADAGGRDRWAEVLRVRADAYRDSGNPAAALAEYRKVALRRPDDLEIAERIAECLHAVRQIDRALEAYSDLGRRLQSRGELRTQRLDAQNATKDIEKATRIRAWLASRGRPG